MRRGRPPHPDVLTPREWEVLALIREGLTNDQIAQRLGLTERGARFHVSEILSKLGVDSRKQAAEWHAPRKPFALGGILMTSGAAAAIAIAVLAMAALAIGIYAMNSRASGTDDPSGAAAEEKATADFLSRVEAALTSPDKVARVLGRTEFIGPQGQAQAQWSTEALYDLPNQSARVLITKDPSSRLDIPDQRIELTTGGSTYDSNLGDREPVSRFSTAQRPACFPGEPPTVVLKLLCWEHTTENVTLNVEGLVDFEDRKVQSLALTAPNGATNRLLVDPGTFLPVAQMVTAPGQGSFSIRTVYSVEMLDRSALQADFFDPRSLGYVPPQETELAILDDPALPVRVYWPGRILSGTRGFDAQLERVDRRSGQQVGRDGPGHVLTISYAGPAGRFRLDYWPIGNWEEFQRLLGGGFIWAQCSERHVLTGGPGEIVILKGFDPGSRPLAGVQIAGATPISDATSVSKRLSVWRVQPFHGAGQLSGGHRHDKRAVRRPRTREGRLRDVRLRSSARGDRKASEAPAAGGVGQKPPLRSRRGAGGEVLIRKLLVILLSSILVMFGGFLSVWGGYIALKIFADYKDSPDSTYLTIGIPLVAVGLIGVAAGLAMANALLLRRN